MAEDLPQRISLCLHPPSIIFLNSKERERERPWIGGGVWGSRSIDMASTDGLVPITRAFLASYYNKYPFPPLSDDVSRLSSDMASLIQLLTLQSPPSKGSRSHFCIISFCWISSYICICLGEASLIEEANQQPPHKIDENMWKNREQMEEILFLLQPSRWPVQVNRFVPNLSLPPSSSWWQQLSLSFSLVSASGTLHIRRCWIIIHFETSQRQFW